MAVRASFEIGARLLFGRSPKLGRRKASGDSRNLPRSGMGGAVLGVAISLVPLVLVLLVSDGMIQGITARYLATKTHHAQVALPLDLRIEEERKVLEALRSIPGVESAFLERNGEGIAVSKLRTQGVTLRSISPDYYESDYLKAYLEAREGQLVPRGNGIVIGVALAEKLGLGLGDTITLVTASKSDAESGEGEGGSGGILGLASAAGYSPRLSFFKVTGIVSAGYRDLDANWVFLDEARGRRLIDYPSSSLFAGLRVREPYGESLGSIVSASAARLQADFPSWFNESLARPWPEIEESLFRSFATTKSMLALIMAIALLVACLNLGSALSTFVAERSLEIAIMRSYGSTNSDIGSIFVGAGLVTGGLGTILGLGFGLALSLGINGIIAGMERIINFFASAARGLRGESLGPIHILDPAYYLERIPIQPDISQILLLGAASLCLCLLASLLPARKAMKVSVLDLMRKS